MIEGRLAPPWGMSACTDREAPTSRVLREALRERVKELTCLYGMARLAARSVRRMRHGLNACAFGAMLIAPHLSSSSTRRLALMRVVKP